MLFNREFGWDRTFEALIAEIVARYVGEFRPGTDRCWIAERAGEAIGSVFFVGESERIGRLRLLCVEPSARGLGVGRALVGAVLDHACERGFDQVTLWTSSLLRSARPIYEAAGFTLSRSTAMHRFGRHFEGQDWDVILRDPARSAEPASQRRPDPSIEPGRAGADRVHPGAPDSRRIPLHEAIA